VLDGSKRKIASLLLKNGEKPVFDQYVLAVPWTAAAKLLPEGDRAQQLATTLIPGPILGIHLWTDLPLAPDLITGFLDSPLHWLFDRTSTLSSGNGGHLYAAVISAITDRIDQSGKELVDLVLSEIHRLIPSSRNSKVTHHVVYKSRDATFSGVQGKPLARPGPITSVENLFLAGDWTETGLPATIEGAVVSGFNSASAIA
jgi:predicted NAD/FAD-dependent oxidoreductase